jgi:hypothetical protein
MHRGFQGCKRSFAVSEFERGCTGHRTQASFYILFREGFKQSAGLTGLSKSFQPSDTKPVGPTKGQKLADVLDQDTGPLNDHALSLCR